MNYKLLNLNQWSRYQQYQFFKKYDNPFFNICTSVDVTALVDKVKCHSYAFSTSLLYASIYTANQIPEFKYRLKQDEVIICDTIYAGSTILNADESFSFCYFDYFSDFKAFYHNARRQIELHKAGKIAFDGRNNDTDIIHYSIIPWITFSSFSHPRNYTSDDSIPKIVFGRYQLHNNRLIMPISIEVHHALMDGLHVGQYLQRLQALLDNPNFIT